MGEIIKRTKNGKFLGYYLRWYEGGRRRQMASKQATAADAKRMLQAIEGRIARGLVGLEEPAAPAPTVAELCERFLSEYSRPRIKDIEKYRQNARTALKRALPVVGQLRADAVEPADVSKLREALGRRGAANSTRFTLFMLGTVFSWAVRLKVVKENPFRGVEMPQRRDAMEYLTADEVRALVAAAERRAASGDIADRCLRAAILFAVYTGVRKGELAALRWRDLDVESGRLTISRSFESTPKSDKARHLRLPDAVVPVLREWMRECPRTTEGLVFPRLHRDGSWGMLNGSSDMLGLPSLIVEAGCRPISRAWHSLRHTMASHYVMAGGSLLALSKILGHSDIKVTMLYAHLAPDFIGAEMNRIRF